MIKIPKLCCSDRALLLKREKLSFGEGALLAGVPIVGDFISGIFGSDASKYATDMAWELGKANLDYQYETRDLQQYNFLHQLDWTEQQQDKQNAYNKQMWDLNNQYNTPQAQLERAQQAGINPNVVFGSPVASSPVQSVTGGSVSQPNLTTPHMDINPAMLTKGSAKFWEAVAKSLEHFKDLPFVREKLQGLKEDNDRKRLENEMLEFDKWERELEKKRFEGFGYFKGKSGRVVTPEEYNRLSDYEKADFLNVKSYKNKMFDKEISPEYYHNELNDVQKKDWIPQYSSDIPELQKSIFHSKADYDNYMSLYSFGNTLSNIEADALQNIIRKKVSEGQLKHTSVIDSMIYMPEKSFEQIARSCEKSIQETKSLLARNKGLEKRLENDDRIAQYTADRMENDLKTNAIEVINKYVPEGALRDFAISMYAILKEINSFKR